MLFGAVVLACVALDGVGVGAGLGVWHGSGEEMVWGSAGGVARGRVAVDGGDGVVEVGWCSGPSWDLPISSCMGNSAGRHVAESSAAVTISSTDL